MDGEENKKYSISGDTSSFLNSLPLKDLYIKINARYVFVSIYIMGSYPRARQRRSSWVEVGIKSKLQDIKDIDLINLHQESSNAVSGSVKLNQWLKYAAPQTYRDESACMKLALDWCCGSCRGFRCTCILLATSLPTSTYIYFHLEAQIIANSIANSPSARWDNPVYMCALCRIRQSVSPHLTWAKTLQQTLGPRDSGGSWRWT